MVWLSSCAGILRAAFEFSGGSPLLFNSSSARIIAIDPADYEERDSNSPNIMLLVTRAVPFAVPELEYQSLFISLPVGRWSFALSGQTLGAGQLYQERLGNIEAVYRYSQRCRLGIGLVGYQVGIRNYGTLSAWAGQLSWAILLEENISWFTILENIYCGGMSRLADDLPRVIQTGVRIGSGSLYRGVIRWEQDLQYPGRLYFDLVARPLHWLGLVVGYYSDPAQILTGIGFTVKGISVEYHTITHPQLGLSRVFSLGFGSARR
ncbi:MAG: hypothetical protein ABIA75_02085 [Candidatus Neomarinimicrobiota bacterium]